MKPTEPPDPLNTADDSPQEEEEASAQTQIRWNRGGARYTDQLQAAPEEVRILDALHVAQEPVSLHHLTLMTLTNLREARLALHKLQLQREVICTHEGTYTLFNTPHGARARCLEALLAAQRPLSCASLAARTGLPQEACAPILEELCLQSVVEAHRGPTEAFWLRGGRVKVEARPGQKLRVLVQDWMGRPLLPTVLVQYRASVYLVLQPQAALHLRSHSLEEAVRLAHQRAET